VPIEKGIIVVATNTSTTGVDLSFTVVFIIPTDAGAMGKALAGTSYLVLIGIPVFILLSCIGCCCVCKWYKKKKANKI
jgi:hypothetical protein